MANEELLMELEDSLRHFFCAGIKDDVRREVMEKAVIIYVREEVVKLSDEEIMGKFNSQEDAFKQFFEYLMGPGRVATDEGVPQQ